MGNFGQQQTTDRGSATKPGYSFNGTLTTGIFSPAANVVSFTTNGTERGRVDVGGNWSFGTAGYYGPFTVVGAAALQTSSISLVSPGTAQGELSGVAFYSTFTGQADNAPRRCADITAGFSGIWGGEYLSLRVGNAGVSNDSRALCTEIWRVNPTNLAPATDNAIDIGTSVKSVKSLYLVNQPNVRSDRNYKVDIRDLTANEISAWSKISPLLFRLKSGTDMTMHAGYIAQDVDAAFKAVGLDASTYGLLLKDSEGCFMLRYGECAVFEAAYQRQRATAAEARLSALEAQMTSMSKQLNVLGIRISL